MAMALPESKSLSAGRGSSSSSSSCLALLRPLQHSSPNPEAWVSARMNYVTRDTTLISIRRDTSGSDSSLQGATWTPTDVSVHNARLLQQDFHRRGFQLTSSQVSHLNIDFYNQQDVVDRYYAHCEQLLETMLGPGVQVKAFDHNVRSNGSNRRDIQNSNGAVVQNPAGVVHADYTCISAPRRLEQLGQPPKANDVLKQKFQGSILDPQLVKAALQGKRRYAFVNVWRNICKDAPVQQLPLAFVDASSMHWQDLRTFQIHYTDRIGENYFCCPNESHKWYYFPNMVMDEAILLKQWDSEGTFAKGEGKTFDDVLSTFTVHSAFIDPTSSPDAPPRESIEVRCIVIWDEVTDSALVTNEEEH